ncbi:hypothetical protein ACTXGQ_07995 [Marinobacter sp. 1Y8]
MKYHSKPHATSAVTSTLLAVIVGLSPMAWAEDVTAETGYEFSGTATDMDTQGVIYTEDHRVTGTCTNSVFQPQNRQVIYRLADDAKTALATKTMRYDQSPRRPSYTFEQPNVGEKINARNQEDKRLLIKADMGENDKKTFELALNDQVVVDAGFLSLIRQHWQALQAGNEVPFEFLSPTRGKTYDFIAEPVTDSRVDVALAIKIRPASMLLNWIVDPVLLGFDAEGRLTDYIGLSNIRKTSDSNFVVHLKYPSATLPCALISPEQS